MAAGIAVVVLNWLGADDTIRCLASLAEHAPDATPVVVDNGSGDDSVERIRAAFPSITLLETGQNLGYAGGNNHGLRWALAQGFELIAVLNNDTVAHPGMVDALVAAVAEDPTRRAVSPVIRYLDHDGIWFAGSRLDERRGIHVHTSVDRAPTRPVATPALSGCAILAHRDVWSRVGLFDEGYFLIFEDADWSRRAVAAGCELVVVPDAVLDHAVSASFVGEAGRVSTYYYLRNGLRLLLDQGAPARTRRTFVADTARATLAPVRRQPRVALAAARHLTRGYLDARRGRSGPHPTSVSTQGVPMTSTPPAPPPPTSPRARVLAFHLPQFHPIPENDEWWEPGFTEWTNTARARRRFPGHYQPHVPADLGFYDLRLPEARAAQADLARQHGIEGFVFWHYWFGDGRRILERPVDEIIASGEPDFPFALAWANQTWSGIWHGAADRVLMEQRYPGVEDERAHFAHLLPAFTDPRYLTVDGRPLFYVFRPEQLPDPAGFVERWQAMAVEAGLPGLYLVAEASDLLGKGATYTGAAADGFDASLYMRLPAASGGADRALLRLARKLGVGEVLRHAATPYPIPADPRLGRTYPTVYPNWDNSPRSGKRAVIIHGSTPELFRTHLHSAIDAVSHFPADERLVFVKSWNEWAEGNHLEPDQRFGRAYLEAVRDEVHGGSRR